MRAAEFLERIRNLWVLIVGDVCLDHWCTFDPELAIPSAETGIPRLAVTKSEATPGAAGTVATNLTSLGVGQVSILGVIGDDGHGVELLRALARRGIATDLILQVSGTITFTYTKLLNAKTGVEDQPRVDFLSHEGMPPSTESAVCERLREFARQFDVVCVSDQMETERAGVVTANVRNELSALARSGGLVWVDSRRRSELFRHATLKLNELEAKEALDRTGSAGVLELRRLTESPLLMVTYGGRGVDIVDHRGTRFFATHRNPHPVDICGAGDSFTAGAACALALGEPPESAAAWGHAVASVTITKRGTGCATPEELIATVER